MSMLRTFKCSIKNCSHSETEKSYGLGVNNWLLLMGVVFNGDEHPALCPYHRDIAMNFIDSIDGAEAENIVKVIKS